jgi:hypothetical protein
MNETRIERIETKVDTISKDVSSIDKTLALQHLSLQEHMRRTALAEESIELLRKDIEPVRAHVNRIDGAMRLIGVVSILVSITAGLLSIFGLL